MAQVFFTMLLAPLLLAQTALTARVTNPKKVPKNAVQLSSVKSLTVRARQQTASRRVSSVPQLKCVGPASVCSLYQVDVMRCTNEGSDYDQENIQWACRASLPEEFKLGSTDVSCEGYESSDDPYVLKGSCGVEYRLMLTEKGEAKYGKKDEDTFWKSGKSSPSEKYVGYIFTAIFLVVLFLILRGIYRAWQNEARRPGVRRPGHGGGGGPGNDDPPPPYDPYDYAPPKKPRTSTGTRTNSSRATGGNQRNQNWRPGFWTGTMAGAAAGYLAGNRNQTPTQPETTRRGTGGGLFGGGNRQPSSSSASSSSTPSYSSTRHESTGFGSTSRR